MKQETGLEPEQAFTLLNTCLRALERSGQIRELGKLVNTLPEERTLKLEDLGIKERQVGQLILSLLHMGLNPASVKTQLLPMLSLPNDLKEAIRQKGLKGAHALVLATLSPKTLERSEKVAAKERGAATETVLISALNVTKTRELVAEIKAKYTTVRQSESKRMTLLIKRIDKLMKPEELKSASPEQLTELRQKLAGALKTLEEI